MSSITELIPRDRIKRFIKKQAKGQRLLALALTGAHAYGYPHRESPFELKAIHVEPTENLVGLKSPHFTKNWIGEYEGINLDYSSTEIGLILKDLLKGDGAILEIIMAPRQFIKGEDLTRLKKIAKGAISIKFIHYYKGFCNSIIKNWDRKRPSLQHILQIYRTLLTGIHLLREGKFELNLTKLAHRYSLEDIPYMVDDSRRNGQQLLEDSGVGLSLLSHLSKMVDESKKQSPLPLEPKHPEYAEDYLLDLRRRFYDALTVQD